MDTKITLSSLHALVSKECGWLSNMCPCMLFINFMVVILVFRFFYFKVIFLWNNLLDNRWFDHVISFYVLVYFMQEIWIGVVYKFTHGAFIFCVVYHFLLIIFLVEVLVLANLTLWNLFLIFILSFRSYLKCYIFFNFFNLSIRFFSWWDIIRT